MARPDACYNLYFPHNGNSREKALFNEVWKIQQELPKNISIEYCRRANGNITIIYIIFGMYQYSPSMYANYRMYFYNTTKLNKEEVINYINNKLKES